MKSFINLIKYDYLQRTRSYAFLITVCSTLVVAYTFVPEPNASYSTISIGNHIGFYNSAWFGYVTAIMTSLFLSLFGFYLVNNSIKRDIDSKVGQIVAATPIRNFIYLCSKALSNFLVLGTIAFLAFLMSIVLFMLYNDGYPFELFQFIKPYVLITLPALFFISVLAIVFEVIFGRYSIFQNIIFFFVFSFLSFSMPTKSTDYSLDVFGAQIVIGQMEREVKMLLKSETATNLSIGYVMKSNIETDKFEFNGFDFPTPFIISRILWILFGVGIIGFISPFFHRFNMKELPFGKKKLIVIFIEKKHIEIVVKTLSKPTMSYGILPLFKTELLLLLRKGKRWFCFFNLVGMVLLASLPLDIAHQMVLPALWFLQVHRLSNLTSKELSNKVHYFAFSAYNPLSRLLTSQLLAGIVLMIFLALPLVIRLTIEGNISAVVSVVVGGKFIVMVAALFGIVTKGKKFFEILFFLVTYGNINGIPFVDYFGATTSNIPYVLGLMLLFLGFTYFFRRKELAML